MLRYSYLLLIFQLAWLANKSWAQHSPYSLQAAVDELHHREAAKFPLNAPPMQQHYYSGGVAEQDYWDDDNSPASVFRERETQNLNNPEHSELTEQFLREIDEAQEHERESRYKEALRHLWEKYQQQENEIEGDLFEEKKRMRVPPYYMLMQKKRSYPVLPWYSDRKKRFPVSKRSTKRSPNENLNLGKTDEKVAKELSEIFGIPNEEKKKRSIDEQTKVSSSTNAPTDAPSTVAMRLEMPAKRRNDTAEETPKANEEHHDKHNHEHHGHSLKEHKHSKRSDHHQPISHESHEEEEDSEEHDDHEHDDHEGEEDSEEEDFDEGDEEERKKKREVSSERSSYDEAPARRKKSIQWSKYFGLDRKKKSIKGNEQDVDVKKRNAAEDNSEDNKMKKRDLDPEKIDNMDKKLQSIEDFIIDETIKYTGSHEGISNPEEIRRLKDHVLSRLATAYSLEKMRRALEKLRQSVDSENHLIRNAIESDDELDENDFMETQKRVAVKKDKANPHEEYNNNVENDELEKKKKRKRNGYQPYQDLPNDFIDIDGGVLAPNRFETLNDVYLGNKNYIIGSNQCPLIEAMAERCRGVDLLSGDINQELLAICGVHQICYLCGTSQVACDYQYLKKADAICEINNDCQAAARSVLMILRGTPGPQLGPTECLKNPCLYSAMREIGL